MEALSALPSRSCANVYDFGRQADRQGLACSAQGTGFRSQICLLPTVSGNHISAGHVTANLRDSSGNAASSRMTQRSRPCLDSQFGKGSPSTVPRTSLSTGVSKNKTSGGRIVDCETETFDSTSSRVGLSKLRVVHVRWGRRGQNPQPRPAPFLSRMQSHHWMRPGSLTASLGTPTPGSRFLSGSVKASSGDDASWPAEDVRMEGVASSEKDFQARHQLGASGGGRGATVVQWSDIWSFLTPLRVSKWGFLFLAFWGLLTLAWKTVQTTALNPKFLMYASWFFVVWPWPAAIAIGAWTLKTATKQKERQASDWEQLGLLAGALTWLVLVPCGHFQGYVDGWPLALYCFYFVFFCISSIVRLRLYGDLSPRERDKQWATKTSRFAQVGFVFSVVAGHWLAAREAFHLEKNIPWSNSLAWALLVSAFVLHWKATFYLGKYFDRLVVPKTVVTYGPYRWVRHPIYASYMLLFVGFCMALRSYVSLVFLLSACMLYYSHRTSLEEGLLVDSFGDLYTDYQSRVKSKFIPYIV